MDCLTLGTTQLLGEACEISPTALLGSAIASPLENGSIQKQMS